MLSPEQARELWISELRSGKWIQGTGALCQSGKHCCLGVACELAIKDGVPIEKTVNWGEPVYYGGYHGFTLPPAVLGWLGLQDDVGSLTSVVQVKYTQCTSLASMNDVGATFPQIADIIEKGLVRNGNQGEPEKVAGSLTER